MSDPTIIEQAWYLHPIMFAVWFGVFGIGISLLAGIWEALERRRDRKVELAEYRHPSGEGAFR
jgi:hypothetical protein